MEEKILYHGSRTGIMGQIRPISRNRCDFGTGFYMGEHKEQAAGLVLNEEHPKLYTLRLSILDDAKILYLNNRDWLYAVLANRRNARKFNELETAKKWRRIVNEYDIVVGKIADDKMNDAIKEFVRNALTDKALYGCLQYVDYGNQYVAKTGHMCSQIEILDEMPVNEHTFPDLAEQMERLRLSAYGVVAGEREKHLRDGLFLSEIVEIERQKERGLDDYER